MTKIKASVLGLGLFFYDFFKFKSAFYLLLSQLKKSLSQTLSYDEFLCFALIYASHADLEFSKPEKEQLIHKFGESTFDKMNSLFDSVTDFQALEILQKHKQVHLSEDKQHTLFIRELENQFNIDEFSKYEKETLFFLNKFI